MTTRIAMLGQALALMQIDALRSGPVLDIRRDPWEDDGWLGMGRELQGWNPPRRRGHRDLPNNWPKSKAVKRRRARNRMAARSRRKNRK